MAPLSKICRKFFLNSALQRSGRLSYRLISTSERKEDTEKACDPQQAVFKKPPDFSKPLESKNWVSYGMDREDEANDKFKLHFYFLCLISVMLCGSIFIFWYLPDRNRNDWARREAFIRLHEREQLGLDPIDPNYVDPKKVLLPPDEELREEDIVI